MYDMYPEWGPAQHDEDHPANPANWSARTATATMTTMTANVTSTMTATAPIQEAIDLRDNGGQRPDDN